MVWIKGSYTTNHPKDKAARAMQESRRFIREDGCTKRELNNPTERNVQKCMHEMRNAPTVEKGIEAAKFLGEKANFEKDRRH